MRLPRIVEPLRHRDFRLLWTGQTLTLLGSFVSYVAYPFQILQLGGSALELGALVSIFTGASLVFLLIGGAVADRVARRTLIVVTELGSGVTVGVIAILGFAGALQIWHLYVTYAIFGAATAFSVPALGAIIPELVPEEILVAGNAVVFKPATLTPLCGHGWSARGLCVRRAQLLSLRRRRRADEGALTRRRVNTLDSARDP